MTIKSNQNSLIENLGKLNFRKIIMQEYLFILDFEISDEYINFPAEGGVGGRGGGLFKTNKLSCI